MGSSAEAMSQSMVSHEERLDEAEERTLQSNGQLLVAEGHANSAAEELSRLQQDMSTAYDQVHRSSTSADRARRFMEEATRAIQQANGSCAGCVGPDGTAGMAGSLEGVARGDGLLNDADIAAIGWYTSTGYAEANEALRSGDPARIQQHIDDVNACIAAIDKLERFEGTTFRGTNLTMGQIQSYVPGVIKSEAGFTSSSHSVAVAREVFMRSGGGEGTIPVSFTIQSRTGADLGRRSLGGEAEVLFRPGARFMTIANSYDRARGIQNMILREV